MWKWLVYTAILAEISLLVTSTGSRYSPQTVIQSSSQSSEESSSSSEQESSFSSQITQVDNDGGSYIESSGTDGFSSNTFNSADSSRNIFIESGPNEYTAISNNNNNNYQSNNFNSESTRTNRNYGVINNQGHTQCKGANETLVQCPEWSCQPKTCAQLGYPQSCPIVNQGNKCPGKPQCLCKDGFLRNSKGLCIPQSQCPSCGGDPNAVSGCGSNCGRLCSNYNKEPVFCALVCRTNACDCKKDYVFDESEGKCVLPSQCPPSCGQNEKYSTCVNGGCFGAKTCKQVLSSPDPIPTVCVRPRECIKGCDCAEGYVRNDNNVCVKPEECQDNQKCTKRNEFRDPCPPNCSPQTCASLTAPPPECPVQPAVCRPACRCAEGFYRDSRGECIPKDQCPQECPKNEVWDSCENGGCQNPRTCKQFVEFGNYTICIDLIAGGCKGKCKCVGDWLRNDQGVCVPPKQCPPPVCKGANETLVQCPDGLCAPKTCDEVGYPQPCPDLPQNGQCPSRPQCLCKDGLVKDANGKCIPVDQCPSCGGDPNATSGCGVNCGRLCSNYNKGPVACPEICLLNGCDCKKDYVYDEDSKKCVLPSQCPLKCTGPNEVADECPPNCSPQTCDSLIVRPFCPAQPAVCRPACRCSPGYYRNGQGICIPEYECPKPCSGPNEEYVACPPNCPPNTCESIGKSYNCPAQIYGNCSPECRCKAGFYRNKIGQCISKNDCLKCTGPNEFYSCGGACDNVCSTLSQQNQTNCPIVNIKCNEMCYCEEGYARNRNGTCIPISECSKVQCGKNQVYEDCPNPCPARRCGVDNSTIRCAAPPKPGSSDCKPECRCKDGFLENDNGVCVPENQCPTSCGGDPNATPGCGVNCGRLCSNYNKGPVACPAICNINGCDCKKNYVFNEDSKKCVLPSQCPVSCNGDPNAKPGCGVNCGRLCSNYNKGPVPCPRICKVNACDCKEGYVLDENRNICVLPSQCPPTCPVNEVWDSCENGGCQNPRNCTQYIGRGNYTICIKLAEGACRGKCKCAGNLLRNDKGLCVPVDKCPTPKCGKNQVFDLCPNPCPARDCGVDPSTVRCFPPPVPGSADCKPGCRCQDGFLKNDKGECIPQNQCPPRTCTGPNEEYVKCSYSCPPNTCESIGKVYACPAQVIGQCRGECKCKSGFYRNKIGQCISEKDCLKCTGPNEYFSCGGACDNVCSNLRQQNQTNCPIVNVKCNEMCYCEQGYARDRNGTCIPISDCSKGCPGAYEWNDSCAKNCPPQTCASKGQIYFCPFQNCTAACRCEDNYLRDNEGRCIPESQCPEPTTTTTTPKPVCPRGQKLGCGANCNRKCSNFFNGPSIACPRLQCTTLTCQCDPSQDYYYDEISKKCVPSSRCPKPTTTTTEAPVTPRKPCPKTCPKGQTISCGNNCNRMCSNFFNGPSRFCPTYQCTDSNSNCECDPKQGYYYDPEKKKCVPSSQCPKPTTTTTEAPTTQDPNPGCKCPAIPTTNTTDDAAGQQDLEKGINDFALKFLQQVLATQPNENVIMSPLSAQIALTELALYTEKESNAQLLGCVNLKSNDQVRQVLSKFLPTLVGGNGVDLDLAVKLWINQKFSVCDAILVDTDKVFNGTVGSLDCNDPQRAASEVNQWVESKTNNRIKDLIPAEEINALVELILVNAIYYKGTWKKQFNKNDTKSLNFYTSDNKTMQVPTMYMEASMRYTDSADLDAQIVELPYVNPDIQMVLVVPKTRYGLAATVSKLNGDTLQQALDSLYETKCKLYLPTLEASTSIDLTSVLKSLGITDIFDANNSGITGISKTCEYLSVSYAIQKAYIGINEEGSEATAATGIVISGRTASILPPPSVITVRADHPFLFAIKKNGAILFIGAVNKG